MKGVYLQYHCPWRNTRDSRQKLIIATNSRAGMRPEAQAIVRAQRSLFDPAHHRKSKKHAVDRSTESNNPAACRRHVSATVGKFVPRLGTKGSFPLYLYPRKWSEISAMHAVCVGGIKFHFSYPPQRSWWALIFILSINHTYLVTNHSQSLKYHSLLGLWIALEVWMQYMQFYFILVERVIVGQFLPTIVRCDNLMTFSDP